MSGAAGVGHLSIGEVLALVQQDFPDVTISKIRFLESQGLIAPERTAAGYRKFYDSDIERLRWILRQQRDHFLPLKVIRKMLDQGVDVSPDSEAQPTLWSAAATGPTEGAADDDADALADSPGRPLSNGAAGGAAPSHEPTIDVTETGRRGEADPTQAEDDPDAAERATYRSPAHPAVASAPRRAPGSGSGARSQPGAGASRTAAPPARPSASGGAAVDPSEAGREAKQVERTGGQDAPGEVERRPAFATPADVVAALQEEPRTRRRAADRPADRPGGGSGSGRGTGRPTTGSARATPGDSADAAPGSDVRMGREELCAASGLTPEQLSDLEGFGLIEATVLGGDPQYDGSALEVARVAARYAELGVSARHLRMYKVAAEREAGFVEQLVVPLIKQRNPEAHAEARARSEELQRMGAELHASLLRRRLGPTLGG